MKGLATLIVGVILGYSVGSITPHALAAAQAQTAPGQGNRSVLLGQPAEGQYWDSADINRIHADRLASGVARGPHPLAKGMQSRTHSINPLTRLYHDRPVPAALTGTLSEFDNGKIHEGVTDIYFIVAGSGRVSVGGELQNKSESSRCRRIPAAASRRVHRAASRWRERLSGQTGRRRHIPPGVAHWAVQTRTA
jgi:hypothetical protein